jgi:hypothetical protein
VCSKFAAFVDVNGAAMISEEVKSPDPESPAKSEEARPKDPDTARGEAFKRMFPEVHRKPPERPNKPSE